MTEDARLSRISTCWTLLEQAHHGQGDDVAHAQRRLLHRYCGAVYRYLRAALGDPDAAEEMAQEFALRFIRGDFKRANPQRGRFRDFIKTVLYHLIIDHHRNRQRQPAPLPTDPPAVVCEDEVLPSDQAFIDCWRQELLDRTWAALQEEEQQTGHLYYTVLSTRASAPDATSEQLAQQLGARLSRPFTEANVRTTLSRARERFARLLLDEVGRSLETTDVERIEEELMDLGLYNFCRGILQRRSRP